MSTTAADQIDLVLTRLRDPTGMGTTRDQIRSLLNRTQAHINAVNPGFVVEVSYSLAPQRSIVHIDEFGDGIINPKCLRVLRVVFENKDLTLTSWRQQAWADATWMRAVEGDLQSWGRIGHDLFFVAPARKAVSLITIVYAAVPTPMNVELDIFELRDDRLSAVAALAEAIGLLRQRDPAGLDAAVGRMTETLTRLPPAGGTSL